MINQKSSLLSCIKTLIKICKQLKCVPHSTDFMSLHTQREEIRKPTWCHTHCATDLKSIEKCCFIMLRIIERWFMKFHLTQFVFFWRIWFNFWTQLIWRVFILSWKWSTLFLVWLFYFFSFIHWTKKIKFKHLYVQVQMIPTYKINNCGSA